MKRKDYCLHPGCGLVESASCHLFDHEFVSSDDRPRFGDQRKQMRPRSEEMEKYYREVRRPAVSKAVGNGRQPCQVAAPNVCTGWVEGLHEPATRGRSGGLQRAVEAGGTVPSCHACNRWISQTAEGQRWASERGLLRHAPPSQKVAPRRRSAFANRKAGSG